MLQTKKDKSSAVKYSVLGVCLCFNLFAVFTLLLGEHSFSNWQKDVDELENMKVELALISKQNEELSTKIRLLNNDADYLEKQIRQQLNYVKKSEVLYIFENEQDNPYWSEGEK